MKVLVIGELCEDIFIYCECKRLSPEAPVPILNPIEITRNDGMAGNVVNNLISIDKNIYVERWHQSQKITKTRFVDKKSNHMFLRLDEGEENISPINLTHNILSDISKYDVVLVSDYDKGYLTHEFLNMIGNSSKLSILDSKKKLTKKIINSFTFVKLNEKEAKNNEEFKDCKNIITTLGSGGASYDGTIYPSPNPKETIDVSGAGDTFTASFILEYSKSKNIKKSIIFANKMASIVVSIRGVATP
jgi:D-beta-D-heptose 7-phosphate kinase/D-beta-D-heptose 1-phosphate adenosyltransferase